MKVFVPFQEALFQDSLFNDGLLQDSLLEDGLLQEGPMQKGLPQKGPSQVDHPQNGLLEALVQTGAHLVPLQRRNTHDTAAWQDIELLDLADNTLAPESA